MPINKVMGAGLEDRVVPVKIWASQIEGEAENQVSNAAKLPFIFSHLAVMSDCHAGKGSTVGTVIATRGAIIPAAIGVDIGCGVIATKLPFKIDKFENLHKLRHSIERSIPVGFNAHKEIKDYIEEWSGWETLDNILDISGLDKSVKRKTACQLGTLGSGNHFCELCFDENNDAWVVLHSGSRNIGKVLAEKYIADAKGLMKEYFIRLPDPDLAYLVEKSDEFNHYISALTWAQNYAYENRAEMMRLMLKDIYYHLSERPYIGSLQFINCHHNYCNLEHHMGHNVWVTRKGAISARKGEMGIIPGSMGTSSYIVEGLGNVESFTSASHGAGRRMSRKKAREHFTIEDLRKQTEGVECRQDAGVIDEIPGAYKDIDVVMNDQSDLVKIVHKLKQVMCIKG